MYMWQLSPKSICLHIRYMWTSKILREQVQRRVCFVLWSNWVTRWHVMSESHRIKGVATDEAFREGFLWERGNFDPFNFQELRSNAMKERGQKRATGLLYRPPLKTVSWLKQLMLILFTFPILCHARSLCSWLLSIGYRTSSSHATLKWIHISFSRSKRRPAVYVAAFQKVFVFIFVICEPPKDWKNNFLNICSQDQSSLRLFWCL